MIDLQSSVIPPPTQPQADANTSLPCPGLCGQLPGPSALVGCSPCPDKVPWPPPPPAATLSQASGINSLLLQTFHTPSAFHFLGEKIKVSYSAKEFLKPMLHFDRYKNLLNVWCLTSHFLQQDFLSLSSVFLVFSPQTKS